ncbi:hypothetical protein [Polymorphospora rubra]|uniref:Uncharacterized protein n=1 Tax=Polymorphospora rubra TaxID=338584 RepID=A0A810MX29_9ACTN|nr:hypothetical protein [Polymorphospora rubra]BCJ63898.1 hypothetical protein Prubr_09190 [Polymorphospora rubra]
MTAEAGLAMTALNTTLNVINFVQGQVKGLTEGAFRVNGFSGAGFEAEVPLDQLVEPVPVANAQLPMIRGSQSRQHVYWLRYVRRGIGATDKKRVAVDLLVRFTTFDYVPKGGGNGPTDRERKILSKYPCWGIANVSISLMPTGRGRNPFNKFNENGSLDFTITAGSDGLPHFRIEYRVQHGAKTLMGTTIALNHNDVGAFLIHSNGSFEIVPGEGRTDKHFRITQLSGSVHNRPSAPPLTAAQAQQNGNARIAVYKAKYLKPGDISPALAADEYEHKGMKVQGFTGMGSPEKITVSRKRISAGHVATAAEDQGHESAIRLEYLRNGSVLGRRVRTKIRALLLLRFTVVPYLTDPDAHQKREVVYVDGVRYTGFRNVSLTVLEVGKGDPTVVGNGGRNYDVSAVKNRHEEESVLHFAPFVEEIDGQVGSQIRIDWFAEHDGAALRSRQHSNQGQMRLGVNQSGSPVLRLLDTDSNNYFTVIG